MYVAKMFGYDGYIEVNAFLTGAFSIGIISGAYSTEVFRGAVQSIDRGQFEASEVLGFKKKNLLLQNNNSTNAKVSITKYK